MKRLLFLKSGVSFVPNEIPVAEYYNLLSKMYRGDIITLLYRREFVHKNLGNFKVQGWYLPSKIMMNKKLRIIVYFLFTLFFSVYSHYFVKKYDVIISYNPGITAMLAIIIGKLTGAKSIIEVNGNFKRAFKVGSEKPSISGYLKHITIGFALPFIYRFSDAVKFVYDNQANNYTFRKKCKIFIFPNFVPIIFFKPEIKNENYILFIGHPWYLKGVDILIKAFNKIYEDYPKYILKIVGYCPNKKYLRELIGGNERIELLDPVWYEKVIELMSACSLFVIASRTDACPRVLLEAMASKKPIVASNVDGIPSVVRNEETGLLFESENVEELAEKMRRVLSNEEFANKLAENGYKFVKNNLSEECYFKKFNRMIEEVLGI